MWSQWRPQAICSANTTAGMQNIGRGEKFPIIFGGGGMWGGLIKQPGEALLGDAHLLGAGKYRWQV